MITIGIGTSILKITQVLSYTPKVCIRSFISDIILKMDIVRFRNFILSSGVNLINFEKEDFKELREYIPGEDIRNIHWISSAKRQKLLSIEKEEIKNQKIALVLLLDKNMLYAEKFETFIKVFMILAYSAVVQKKHLEVYIVTNEVRHFLVSHFKEIETIEEELQKLDLKNVSLIPFTPNHKNYLNIFLGDFFYTFSLDRKNRNILLFIREKVEENPKKLLFHSLKSIDGMRTFLDRDNLKHYLATLAKNDDFYKRAKVVIQRIHSGDNLLTKLKEVLE